MFGVMNHLDIVICEDTEDAIKKGYDYKRPEYAPINIEKCVVVRKGTVKGNSTVDFILEDEKGYRFIVMITGRILKTLAQSL